MRLRAQQQLPKAGQHTDEPESQVQFKLRAKTNRKLWISLTGVYKLLKSKKKLNKLKYCQCKCTHHHAHTH